MKYTFAAMALLVLCGCEHDQVVESHAASAPSPSAVSSASGDHIERIRAANVLRIGVRADSPPFGFVNAEGTPQGFDIDLGYRIASALGVQPVFVAVKSAERLERLKRGDVDMVIATLTATRKRSREVDFSLPYFQEQQHIMVKADSPIQSYRDLGGKTVAASSGTTSIDNLKTVSPDARVVAVDSVTEAFEKLRSGAVDAMTGDGLQLQALRINSADPAQYKLAGEGFSVEPYSIALPQNDSAYRTRVDEILSDLWNSGAWTRIFNKWLGASTPYNMQSHFQMPVLPP